MGGVRAELRAIRHRLVQVVIDAEKIRARDTEGVGWEQIKMIRSDIKILNF